MIKLYVPPEEWQMGFVEDSGEVKVCACHDPYEQVLFDLISTARSNVGLCANIGGFAVHTGLKQIRIVSLSDILPAENLLRVMEMLRERYVGFDIAVSEER
jgi:hypothetical protein